MRLAALTRTPNTPRHKNKHWHNNGIAADIHCGAGLGPLGSADAACDSSGTTDLHRRRWCVARGLPPIQSNGGRGAGRGASAGVASGGGGAGSASIHMSRGRRDTSSSIARISAGDEHLQPAAYGSLIQKHLWFMCMRAFVRENVTATVKNRLLAIADPGTPGTLRVKYRECVIKGE